MSPLFSPSRWCNRRVPLSLSLSLIAVVACERHPIEAGPDAVSPQFAPGSPAPFAVFVKDQAGVAVEKAYVRLVDAAGKSTNLITDAGGAATTSLATGGDYCVSVRMTPQSIMLEPVIAPAQIPTDLSADVNGVPPDNPALRTDVAPVLFNKFGQTNFSAGAWRDCLSRPPTKHNGSGTTLQVVLPPSAQYTLPLAAPDGRSLFLITDGLEQVAGYAVTPVSTRNLTGEYQFPNDAKFRDGFLQFVSVADRPDVPAELKTLKFGVTPLEPFQVEFQQSVRDARTGRIINLTATLKTQTAAAAGSDNELDLLVAEPLYCRQDYVEYRNLTKFISSNAGFMADANPDIGPGVKNLTAPLIPNRTVVAMELVVKGGDAYTVTFREDLSTSSRLVTDVSFSCNAAGDCSAGTVKYSGSSGHILFPFFRSLGDGTGKATFFLTGLSDPNAQVSWAAKATGEALPVASKKNASAAFTPIAEVRASSCPIQDSNDDKFFMGW